MIGLRPMCEDCIHLIDDGDKPVGTFRIRCTAFPDGIPDRIYVGGVDHRKPFPGDNGIRFKAKPDALEYH